MFLGQESNLKRHCLRLASKEDVPRIRELVNASYKELSEMGLNYTASYQDEVVTAERLAQGRGYLLELDSLFIGAVLLSKKNFFTNRNSAYISQLAVAPDQQKKGYGTMLVNWCEFLAKLEHFESIQLDTAKPAGHLVQWYLKSGYEIVGESHWEGKTYDSWIFEKVLR